MNFKVFGMLTSFSMDDFSLNFILTPLDPLDVVAE